MAVQTTQTAEQIDAAKFMLWVNCDDDGLRRGRAVFCFCHATLTLPSLSRPPRQQDLTKSACFQQEGLMWGAALRPHNIEGGQLFDGWSTARRRLTGESLPATRTR